MSASQEMHKELGRIESDLAEQRTPRGFRRFDLAEPFRGEITEEKLRRMTDVSGENRTSNAPHLLKHPMRDVTGQTGFSQTIAGLLQHAIGIRNMPQSSLRNACVSVCGCMDEITNHEVRNGQTPHGTDRTRLDKLFSGVKKA